MELDSKFSVDGTMRQGTSMFECCIENCNKFLDMFPEAENGPAHVVLSDYNFETEHIESAIATLKTQRVPTDSPENVRKERVRLETLAILRTMLNIPENERLAGDDR